MSGAVHCFLTSTSTSTCACVSVPRCPPQNPGIRAAPEAPEGFLYVVNALSCLLDVPGVIQRHSSIEDLIVSVGLSPIECA